MLHVGLLTLLLQVVTAKNLEPHSSYKAPSVLKNNLENPWKGADWNQLAQQELDRSTETLSSLNWNKAKNVIMFLGDGMGVSTVSAARLYHSELLGLKQEDIYLSWEKFPHVALSRTYNVDRSTPDSAGTGTAYLCGVKANYYTIGVNENVNVDDCSAVSGNKVNSVLRESIESGKWTGLVSTARITHASPAAAYAHVANRNWEASVPTDVTSYEQCDDIAYQLVNDTVNENIRVILGGGRRNFYPETSQDPTDNRNGSRTDGLDLMKVRFRANIPFASKYFFVLSIIFNITYTFVQSCE